LILASGWRSEGRQGWTYGWDWVKTQVGSIFVARVGSGKPFLVWVWVWKISPKNPKFVKFFPFGSAQKEPGSKADTCGLLFTVGLKYARVRSGKGPSLVEPWHLWQPLTLGCHKLHQKLFPDRIKSFSHD